SGTVWRIDPATEQVVWTTHLPNEPADEIAAAPGSEWVLSTEAGKLIRIDTRGRIQKETSVGTGAADIAVGGRYVWVLDPTANTGTPVDEHSDEALPPSALSATADS